MATEFSALETPVPPGLERREVDADVPPISNRARIGLRWGVGLALVALLAFPLVRRYLATRDAVHVTAEPAAARVISHTFTASGTFKYLRAASLSAEVLGRIKGVHVVKGQRVKAGAVLISLDADPLVADVTQQRATVDVTAAVVLERVRAVEQAERDLAHDQRLYGLGALAATKVDTARDAHSSALNALEESRKQREQARASLYRSGTQLAKATIRAPIDGVVIALDAKPGETAAVGGGPGLLTIVDPASFIAEASVDEADISHVRPGQALRLFTAAYPGRAVRAQVSAIPLAPMLVKQAGFGASQRASAYAVEARIAPEDAAGLLQGMTFRAELVTSETEPTLAVQVQALLPLPATESQVRAGSRASTTVDDEQERFVLVVVDQHTQRRKIVVGISDDQYVQVRSGLRPGEMVVNGPYSVLRSLGDGQKVSVR